MHKHGPETTSVFLPADRKASRLLLPSLVFLLSGSTVQPENTYFCTLKVTGQVWESQKRININANHSYHQHSYPEASLNWSNNKARFSFNQPNRKRWGAKLVDVKHLPHKAFLLLLFPLLCLFLFLPLWLLVDAMTAKCSLRFEFSDAKFWCFWTSQIWLFWVPWYFRTVCTNFQLNLFSTLHDIQTFHIWTCVCSKG